MFVCIRFAADFAFYFRHERGFAGCSFTESFAVPTRAFGVKLVEALLVCFAGPCEAVGKACICDFVVVVKELAEFRGRVIVVGLWVELVRVPCEVNI